MKRMTALAVLLTGCSSQVQDVPVKKEATAAQEKCIPAVKNLQNWIDARMAEGKTKLMVPTGTYRLSPGKIAHLEFTGLKNIEIDFQGSEIICTDRTRAIDLKDCEGVTLKNVSIDYDPKLYAAGRITALTPDYVEIEVFEGYPIDGLSTKDAEVYDPDTYELKPGFRTFHDLKSIERMGGRIVRVHMKLQLADLDRFVEIDDILLIKTERKRFDGGECAPHAVYSGHCRNLRFEKITIFASNCFSFLGEACSNLHYYRCRVDRKKDDPTVAFPRMRSSNWDAFHSINAEIGPTIEECYAGYMGDDAVNIRGDYHIVAGANGAVLTVIGKREVNIQPGDPVEVVTRNGELIAKAQAIAVERFPDYPKEKIEKAKASFPLIIPTNCRDAWRVTLDRPSVIEDTSVVCAVNRIGSGFKIINNVFGHNRSRGILTRANNGLISGNVIEDTGLESLKLSPNIGNWLEAAYYQNLVVTNNIIRNGNFSAHFGKVLPAQILVGGCRTGLVFSGNTIEYSGDTAMIVSDLDGGVIRNNGFMRLDGTATENQIVIENCTNLELK